MRLEVSLQARQEMRLKLAPQIIQSIEILQLPLLELRDRIDQELLENPLLEITEPEEEPSEGEETESEEDQDETEPVEELTEDEEPEPEEEEPIESEDFDALDDLIPAYDDGPPRSRNTGEKDAKLAALENSPCPDVTLPEHLRQQIALIDMDAELREICEFIIANLDWRGYLEYPLEEIAEAMDGEVTMEKAQEALEIVQKLEPRGVGARNINECLLLQLDPEEERYDFLYTLVDKHFEDILKNRYPKVAKSMSCTIDELKEAVDRVSKLNPIPGAMFGEEAAPHVIPDVRIELVEGEYRVILEDAALPSLRICAYYARKLQQEDLDEKTESYLKDKLQSARWLMDAIQQRRSTLFNITSAIVESQEEFLRKGPMYLKPLKMQDIADQVGVHVSTVSRALSGKYVQTPRGIYALKSFFTGGLEKEDGEMESWEVVRQKLLQIIENEDKSKPLSDEEIANELGKQGIEIARRTVSKYRKILSIPSSRRRKEY